MKVRLFPPAGKNIRLPLMALALAATLAGCSSANSPSNGTTGAGAQSGAETSSSATGGSPAAGRHRMAQALAGLGLSDEQKTQIRGIMSATRKENANADPTTRRANFKAAYEKIDAILSPDQRTKLHAKLAQMRKERGAGAPSQS